MSLVTAAGCSHHSNTSTTAEPATPIAAGVGNSAGAAGNVDGGEPLTPKVAMPPPPGADTRGDVAGETTDMSTYAVRHTLSGVPATGRVIDVADGAQLELRAQDPADVDALRETARRHVAEISNGECRHPAG